MKTMMKVASSCAAALALVVVLNGCAEDNEKAVMTDATSGKVTKGVTPANAPKSSDDAYKAMQNMDPMKQAKNYRK